MSKMAKDKLDKLNLMFCAQNYPAQHGYHKLVVTLICPSRHAHSQKITASQDNLHSNYIRVLSSLNGEPFSALCQFFDIDIIKNKTIQYQHSSLSQGPKFLYWLQLKIKIHRLHWSIRSEISIHKVEFLQFIFTDFKYSD